MKWILFGCGKSAKNVLNLGVYNFSYVLDNDENKVGTTFDNRLIVYSPKYIKEEKDEFKIVVASVYYDQIKIQLMNMGLVEGKDFSRADKPRDSKIITIFDTSICDNNLGNQIIMEAVNDIIYELFPGHFVIKLPYLDSIGEESINYINESEYTFFGGTNSLTSHMKEYAQWGISEKNVEKISNVILLGVGWWQYQDIPDEYTKKILRRVLSFQKIHSIRDNYSKNMLQKVSKFSIQNTSCPTVWNLSKDHCKDIARDKAAGVVVTFTQYNQSMLDYQIAKILERYYSKFYVWVQGPQDGQYAKILFKEVELINPCLKDYDDFLQSNNVDYIGTRLHAGIRALQKKKRTLIIAIDNRALEMGKDINLPVIKRENLEEIENFIKSDFICNIKIPKDDITNWKKQFC